MTKNAKIYFRDTELVLGSSDGSISFTPTISSARIMGTLRNHGGWISGGMSISSGGWERFNPQLYCEACGGDISQNDHVAVQIGEDASVYFHKGCYIHPNNQDMIRGLVVAEDLI